LKKRKGMKAKPAKTKKSRIVKKRMQRLGRRLTQLEKTAKDLKEMKAKDEGGVSGQLHALHKRPEATRIALPALKLLFPVEHSWIPDPEHPFP